MAIPTPRVAYPRRVTTGLIRRVPLADCASLRGTKHNYRLTSGQASYALHAAQQRIAA